jgi:hypothetical protein
LKYVFVRRSDMSKLIGLALAAVLLPTAANPAHEKFAKYKAIEAYEIRPGVLMMPRYSSDGQVCEIGLEKLHYSPETIRLDSSLSRKEIDQIFDELVPAGERGPRSKDFAGALITQGGGSLTTNIDFENVSIQIYGAASPADGKGGTTVDEVAATLKWKNRRCQ